MKRILCFLTLLLALAPVWAQNYQGTVLPLASRSAATVTSADQQNYQFRGATLTFNVTTYVAGNYTMSVQGKDPVSSNYYSIFISPAISATGTTAYRIYPGLATVANTTSSDILPRVWRVSITGAGGQNMFFSVGVQLIQ